MVGSSLMESSEKSGIKFDINLTAEEKALLFGSLFLVDYMYFQETSIDRDDFYPHHNIRGAQEAWNRAILAIIEPLDFPEISLC